MSLLDPKWKYTPSTHTDIRKRFKRVQAEQKAAAERQRANEAEAEAKVQQLQRRKP
jgi:hypothetical protein